MAKPLLVKGSTATAGPIIFGILGALLVALGLFLVLIVQEGIPGAIAAGLGLLAVVGAVFMNRANKASHVFLEHEEDGFTILDRNGETTYRDSDILAMATSSIPIFANGLMTKSRRRATFLMAGKGETESIDFDYTHKIAVDDPLGELFDRLHGVLLTRYKEEVAGGGRLGGKGWYIDRAAFVLRGGRDEQVIPYSQLEAVSIIDGQVTVWERGQAEASIRIPISTMNAWVLTNLLNEQIEKHGGGKQPDEQIGDGLGRVMFARDKSLSPPVTGVLLALAAIVMLGGAGLMVFMLMQRAPDYIVAGIALGLGVVTAAATLMFRRNDFRVHSLGVVRHTTMGGKREVLYADIERFTWSATRMHTNGVYTGTTLNLSFTPRRERGAKTLVYNTSMKGGDSELDNLRDFISRIIAVRWLCELQTGNNVVWTGRSVFQPDGLSHKPAKTLRSGEPQLIPYPELSGQNFKEGWFYLWRQGVEKPCVTEQVNQANFFPGYMLATIIMGNGGSLTFASE